MAAGATEEGYSPKTKTMALMMAFVLSRQPYSGWVAFRALGNALPALYGKQQIKPWYKTGNAAAPKQSFTDWYKRIKMSSREKILSAVKWTSLRRSPSLVSWMPFVLQTVLPSSARYPKNIKGVPYWKYPAWMKWRLMWNTVLPGKRITTIPGLTGVSMVAENRVPHSLQHTALAVIQASLLLQRTGRYG